MPKNFFSTRASAEKDYCAGLSVSEIAVKYSLPLRTVKNWYTRENWKERRHAFREKVRESIAAKLIETISEDTIANLNASRMILKMSAIECKKVHDEQQKGQATAKKVAKAAKAYGRLFLLAAKIRNESMPNAREAVLNKLVQDIEKLKEQIDDEDDSE